MTREVNEYYLSRSSDELGEAMRKAKWDLTEGGRMTDQQPKTIGDELITRLDVAKAQLADRAKWYDLEVRKAEAMEAHNDVALKAVEALACLNEVTAAVDKVSENEAILLRHLKILYAQASRMAEYEDLCRELGYEEAP